MSVLKEIYDEQFCVGQPKTLEYLTIRQKNFARFWDEVEKQLGSDFLDKNFEDLSKQEEMENYHYFRQGFRLGVSLMTELLQ